MVNIYNTVVDLLPFCGNWWSWLSWKHPPHTHVKCWKVNESQLIIGQRRGTVEGQIFCTTKDTCVSSPGCTRCTADLGSICFVGSGDPVEEAIFHQVPPYLACGRDRAEQGPRRESHTPSWGWEQKYLRREYTDTRKHVESVCSFSSEPSTTKCMVACGGLWFKQKRFLLKLGQERWNIQQLCWTKFNVERVASAGTVWQVKSSTHRNVRFGRNRDICRIQTFFTIPPACLALSLLKLFWRWHCFCQKVPNAQKRQTPRYVRLSQEWWLIALTFVSFPQWHQM